MTRRSTGRVAAVRPSEPPPLTFFRTSQFERDVKREMSGKYAARLGPKLASVLDQLRSRQPLEMAERDHALKGNRSERSRSRT